MWLDDKWNEGTVHGYKLFLEIDRVFFWQRVGKSKKPGIPFVWRPWDLAHFSHITDHKNNLHSWDSLWPFTNPSLFLLNLSLRHKTWMSKRLVLLGVVYVGLSVSLSYASFDSVPIFVYRRVLTCTRKRFKTALWSMHSCVTFIQSAHTKHLPRVIMNWWWTK